MHTDRPIDRGLTVALACAAALLLGGCQTAWVADWKEMPAIEPTGRSAPQSAIVGAETDGGLFEDR